MRIVHLSSVHPWNDARIFHRMCLTLAQHGHDVHWVMPGEEGAVPAAPPGVTVHPVPLPRNRGERMLRTSCQVVRAARALRADLYHFHDPELIPAALLLKGSGCRVIYDVHEDVPKDIQSKDWIPRFLRGPLGCAAAVVERCAAVCLDGIIAATPSIARRFPPPRTAVVQNFPLIGELSVGGQRPFSERNSEVVYVGSITRVRGLAEVVNSMSLLPESLQARLMLAGEIWPDSFDAELRALPGWNRVEYLGCQNRAQVAALLSRACAAVVTFLPVPNHVEAQPNKLFEYMSAGLPVIASDFPLWRQIIGDTQCGLLVDPADPQAIATAIRWLLEHRAEAEAMGRRGMAAVRQRYNWETESRVLLDFYQRLAGTSGQLGPATETASLADAGSQGRLAGRSWDGSPHAALAPLINREAA